MEPLPAELSRVLELAAAKLPTGRLTDQTSRLIDRYQSDFPAPPGEPIVADDPAATAYALYRMPATYAAVRAALHQAALAMPGFAPRRHCDLGGGTGGAVWAVADTWPTITEHRVIEQSPAMITLGRRLASAGTGAVAGTAWDRGLLDGSLAIPPTDLITISYVLGELAPELRQTMITKLAQAAPTVAIIEPGTKAGYRRILDARKILITAGMRIAAPCPHAEPCPMAADDWCHFAVRVNRSSTHRMIKNAELSYEDEKFSYLIATREPAQPGAARIVRHPRYAKGRVLLTLCRRDPQIEQAVVAKRDQEGYRQARRADWGDRWPTG
ncbi:small ribosomal subunit Rsm22 family protein [Microlunatus speluncae]|uniref:small ribosomal subunit Rsm22 family protein n=1 Tax=Microlunatus speluncae TaxID=2594267 RepID=UPI0012662002|nr:small ribosomal subunit Rsm22 family protein [Microlunatus speluncae]